MKNYSFIFFIKQSLHGLLMNSIMSITSIFFMSGCLILTGCFVLLALNTDLNLRKLDNFNKIIFYIDKEFESEEEIKRIQDEIAGLANTKSMRFISKREAFEEMRDQYENFGKLFEDEGLVNASIDSLEHKIEIEYIDIEHVGTLDYQLRLIPGVAHYESGEPKVKNRIEMTEFIKNIQNIIMFILIGFLVILFVIAVFIILNTVRLSVHVRRQEIIIMRYIGATNFFILFPFLLEGIIIGVVAAFIAYISLINIYKSAINAVLGMEGGFGLEFAVFSDIGSILLAAFVLIGVVCGLFGSGLSSRKYLQA